MRITTIILFLGSLVLLSSYSPMGVETDNKGGINWIDFEEAVKLSEKKNKPIFIDVYTNWCGWCKVMDKKTFSQPEIIDYINKNYYAVKLNAERKDTINFKGKEYVFVKSGRRGYHQLAAILLHKRLSYPTVVFLVDNSSLVFPHIGYQPPDKLSVLLKYYIEEDYKKTDINTYIQNNSKKK